MGGLGLRRTWENNIAAMAKLNWRLCKEEDSVWEKIINAKYFHNHGPISQPISSSSPSVVATNIQAGWKLFQTGIRKVISNGANTLFWYEDWSGYDTLREHIEGPLLQQDESLKVGDVFNQQDK